MESIEIKVREQWAKWEDTPVKAVVPVNNDFEADKICAVVSAVVGEEVRWNYKGCSQGHYIPRNWWL